MVTAALDVKAGPCPLNGPDGLQNFSRPVNNLLVDKLPVGLGLLIRESSDIVLQIVFNCAVSVSCQCTVIWLFSLYFELISRAILK